MSKRAEQSPRTKEAASFGARIVEVAPGYLNVVQARAKAHAAERNAFVVPFGGAGYASAITEAARDLDIAPASVWCAAGSGTLASALAEAWPDASLEAVEVGKSCILPATATKHVSRYPYSHSCRAQVPFSADRYYEAKAWEVLAQQPPARGDRLFWNVAGAV